MRHYLSTVATNIAVLLLGTISGILAARLLGPIGRGELAIIILWPMIVVYIIGSFGLHSATTFFAAREPQRLNALFTALLLLGAAQSVLFGALAYFVLPFILAGHRLEVISLTRLFLLFLPFGFNSLYLLNLLQGRLRMREFNSARVFVAAWHTGLLVVLFYLGRASLSWIVYGQLLGYASALLLHLFFVRRCLRPRLVWEPRIFRPLLSYGLKAQFSNATSYLNLRLDQLVMSVLLPPSALGYYVAAVVLAQPLQSIPGAIGLVTLPRAAREDFSKSKKIIAQSLRAVTLFLTASVIVLYFLVPFLLPVLFGTPFTSAIPACQILVLAAIPLGLIRVLYDSLRALNRPQVPGYAELVANGVTIFLLALLLPRFSFLGAAYASLGAYTASLFFLLWYFHSRLGLSLRRLVSRGRESLEPVVSVPEPWPIDNQPRP